MAKPTPNSTVRRRGTAMTEMVLVLPFIIAILGFVAYFGTGMMRVQHSHVQDRYEAWRRVYEASDHYRHGHAGEHHHDHHLNDIFHAGNADHISRYHDLPAGFPAEAPEFLTDAARAQSDDAGVLYYLMYERFPSGYNVGYRTRYKETIPVFRKSFGDSNIRSSHTRMHNDWRWANGGSGGSRDSWRYGGSRVSHTLIISDEFFPTLDEPLETFAGGGNNYAAVIRGFYRGDPGYRGPDVR